MNDVNVSEVKGGEYSLISVSCRPMDNALQCSLLAAVAWTHRQIRADGRTKSDDDAVGRASDSVKV